MEQDSNSSAEQEQLDTIDMIEFLSSRHSQMSLEHCMNNLTRPQLIIWFEKTANREKKEKESELKADWNKFASLMSVVHNTTMGMKKKDMKKAQDFMPDFDNKNQTENNVSIHDFKNKKELYEYLEEQGRV